MAIEREYQLRQEGERVEDFPRDGKKTRPRTFKTLDRDENGRMPVQRIVCRHREIGPWHEDVVEAVGGDFVEPADEQVEDVDGASEDVANE